MIFVFAHFYKNIRHFFLFRENKTFEVFVRVFHHLGKSEIHNAWWGPPSRTQLFLLFFQYGDPALAYKTTKKWKVLHIVGDNYTDGITSRQSLISFKTTKN